MELANLREPERATLSGGVQGALGNGQGSGDIFLEQSAPGRTRISYRYQASIGGKVATVGGRLLDGAARAVIGQFFAALAARAEGRRTHPWLAWLRRLFGG
jgi:2-furoyl-CoA dehydrogenase large subunit